MWCSIFSINQRWKVFMWDIKVWIKTQENNSLVICFTSMYMIDIDLEGSYYWKFKLSNLQELVHFDDLVLIYGVCGGTSESINNKFSNCVNYYSRIDAFILPAMWIHINWSIKLCNKNDNTKKMRMDINQSINNTEAAQYFRSDVK